MKSRLLLILFIISFATTLYGANHGANLEGQLERLKTQGYVIRMGELTGAGGRMSLSKLKGFIHAEGVVHKKECTAISVKASSDPENPKIADITKVKLGVQELMPSEFIGFFTID